VTVQSPPSAIWHDIECGGYTADLPLWRRLAARRPGPVLEIGAGTGRVALDLAARGHEVLALDRDPELLDELAERGRRLGDTVDRPLRLARTTADARDFELGLSFVLIVVPMQTVQLLDGPAGRLGFLDCAARHLKPGGRLAIALTEHFDPYDWNTSPPVELPAPEVREVSGIVYRSQPTAVRLQRDRVVLERRRERLSPDRSRRVQTHSLVLDLLDPAVLEAEGTGVGLRPARRVDIPRTPDHVGSVVVQLDA
jgi:SAM-dependent methyltransferase